MNKYKIYTILGMVGLLFFTSCSDFLDVNDDPTRVNESEVGLKLLLSTSIERTSAAHYSAAYSACQATHQIDAFGGYYADFKMSGLWVREYLSIMNNLAVLVSKAEEQKTPFYAGVGRVLQAINLGLITDTWEAAPYSEGLKGSEFTHPSYDSQEQLYQTVMGLLDQAIADLGAAEDPFFIPGDYDLAYGGDVAEWVKLAHSLKARFMIHLSNKSPNWQNILNEVDLGMDANSDNFQLAYTSANPNPWFTNVAKAAETGNFSVTHAGYFIDMLNGTNYGVEDPRAPLIADPGFDTVAIADYIGVVSWDEDAPEANTLISTKIIQEETPIVMMSFAEVKFIEAEAALNVDMSRAQAAYEDGIAAHFEQLGADGLTDYLANPAVATADLEHIMKEKFIALFLNAETWVDMRRHHYDPAVYKNFVEPDYLGRDKPGQRALYPDTELQRNTAAYDANKKDFTAPMWRDQ